MPKPAKPIKIRVVALAVEASVARFEDRQFTVAQMLSVVRSRYPMAYGRFNQNNVYVALRRMLDRGQLLRVDRLTFAVRK